MWLPDLIDTPRCVLRKPHPADAAMAYQHYASDPVVTRYLGWKPHDGLDLTQRQISYDLHRWLKRSAWVYSLVHKLSSKVVGEVELIPQGSPPHESHHLRLGYALAQAYWGQGLMSEAASALVDQALAQPDIFRVDAVCDVDNPASARVLEKIGMQREGRLGRYIVHPNVSPEPRDVWLYARVR